METQLLPLHIAAFILTPYNHDYTLILRFAQQLELYIIEKVGEEGYIEYTLYSTKSGIFNPQKTCWQKFSNDSYSFWRIVVSISPQKYLYIVLITNSNTRDLTHHISQN
jgi:hypothetical protein